MINTLKNTYEREIILPKKVELLLNKKSTKAKKGALKIYAALAIKFNQKNNYIDDYISIPATYLRSVNYRYYKFIEELKVNGIIEALEFKPGKEYFNTETGQCKRYKPLIDISTGTLVTVQLENSNTVKNWYKITKESLDYLGLKTSIKRCQFGQRLHTPITHRVSEECKSYKKYFKNIKQNFVVIDAVACQPNLLKQVFNERGISIDTEYQTALDSGFYDYLIKNTKLKNRNLSYNEKRDEAKNLYCIWQNGDKGKSKIFKSLFPHISEMCGRFKAVDPKAVGKMIQRKESLIFIDELLENVVNETGVSFCLTVHDSLIVRKEDGPKVFDWMSKKIEYLNFKMQSL